MKKATSLLLAVLILLSLSAAASAEGSMVIGEAGVTLHGADALDRLDGVVVFAPYGVLTRSPDLFYTPILYYAMPREEYTALLQKSVLSEEELRYARNAQTYLGELFVAGVSAEELLELLVTLGGDGGLKPESIGSADGLNFYYIPDTVESYRPSIGDAWAENYRKAQGTVEELLRSAELYAPLDPEAAVIGRVIRFETVDLDGNPVTSEELFGQNEITMVNFWGTWCHYCVEELDELAAIHTSLQAKGCGIVGILEDADNPEKVELAHRLMAENGTNYPNVALSADMDILEEITGYPTSFFVDRSGVILCPAVVGAAPDLYEATVDALLENTEGPAGPSAVENSEGAYRVLVRDADGNPVQGAAIQLCDDTTCSLIKTDAGGVARFEVPEGTAYIVHVLKVPAGYEADENEYQTLTSYSDLVIVLNSAA